MTQMLGRLRRALFASAVVAGVVAGSLSAGAMAATAPPPCAHPVLILSAMPLELNPLFANAKIAATRTVRIGDRKFYSGTLDGVPVVLALTGIGPVNATETAAAAFDHFRCGFAAALFSGVAGSNDNIGDVIVPQRWTLNNGRTWVGTDPAMFSIARRLAGPTRVKLARDLPLGDAACLCGGADASTPVHLPQRPVVRVGGAGQTTDPFGGQPAPCVWGGGDIAGCEPCVLSGDPARDSANFLANAPALPALLKGVFAPAPPATAASAAQDEETAAVDTVAHRYGVPFLGVRAVSDGKGDPLHLPGFPSQFFVYRQLAGNNAAAVTMAFLKAWAAAGRPI
jgi:nucleoside phosphorylase